MIGWNIWNMVVIHRVKHGCLESILILQRAYESPERHVEFLGAKEASILTQFFLVSWKCLMWSLLIGKFWARQEEQKSITAMRQSQPENLVISANIPAFIDYENNQFLKKWIKAIWFKIRIAWPRYLGWLLHWNLVAWMYANLVYDCFTRGKSDHFVSNLTRK